MRDEPELAEVEDRLVASLGALDEALADVRAFRRDEPTQVTLLSVEAADSGSAFEDAAQRAVRESAHARELVTAAREGDSDSQAIERLLALAAVDAAIADRLLDHAQELEPDEDEELVGVRPGDGRRFLMGAALPEALERLGRERPPLARTAERILGRGGPEPMLGGEEPAELRDTVQTMLARASKSMSRIGSTALFAQIDGNKIVDAVQAVLGDQAGTVARKAVEAARRWYRRFTRWAAEALGELVEKLREVWGGAADKALEVARQWLGAIWSKLIGDDPVITLLRHAFRTDELIATAEGELESMGPDVREKALARVMAIAAGHGKVLGWVDKGSTIGSRIVPFVARTPEIRLLVAGVGGLLVVTVGWFTHDRLDAPGLALLMPDLLDGVGGSISP